jgi:hypothetical protein
VRQPASYPKPSSAENWFSASRQKTFTTQLTPKMGWAYKTPIDAAADADGAKASLKRRAEATGSTGSQGRFQVAVISGWRSNTVRFANRS